jgi:hypothetical protein
MATKKKLLQAAAGSAGGGGLNVEDVFSTYLYEGTGSAQTITNGIDLDGEGGLVWIKSRTSTTTAFIYDTERGATKSVTPSETGAQETDGNTLSVFNTNGFSVGTSGKVNSSSNDYASWTFRKAPKFFDVVTYTGTGSNQNISHSLGCVPGFVVVKKTSGTGNWSAWHRSLPDANDYILLNTTNGALDGGSSYNRSVTDTTYRVFGDYPDENQSGQTYVAYLFAHNDGDGEFGSEADADIIKCGSYTGNGSSTGPVIDLGFEPQWLLIKGTSATDSWAIFDVMRGMTVGSSDSYLFPNSSGAELSFSSIVKPTPTGFQLESVNWNTNTNNYIYIAIRRGPMAVPESATDVFAIDTRGSSSGEPGFKSGFVIDTFIDKIADSGTSGFSMSSRLTQGKFVQTNSTAAEGTQASYQFDYMNGFGTSTSANADYYAWMWKRAPNFFDVVAYTGTGSSSLTVDHNLGVVPEMMWVKRRSGTSDWKVYHKDLTNLNSYLVINSTAAEVSNQTNVWPTAPTDTQLTIGNYTGDYTGGGDQGIAYLFASLDGVSKVGSYTGNGTDNHQIDCGFSNGARMVIIKAASTTGAWKILDTERGIVTGNDPFLHLDSTAVEYTSFDLVDPYSGGFAVNSNFSAWNQSGQTYIFYAIA